MYDPSDSPLKKEKKEGKERVSNHNRFLSENLEKGDHQIDMIGNMTFQQNILQTE